VFGSVNEQDGGASGGPGDPAGTPDTLGDGRSAARKRTFVLLTLCAVAFMAQLDLFIVNVALPSIGHSFTGQGLGTLSWVLNSYAIVFAAFLVPAGRLADHFGRRRFLVAGVLVFAVASGLCAAAPSLAVLVIARALQAVGAAMIVPASLGLLLAAFPKRLHGTVVGIWAGVAAVAASSGPPVGGLLVEASWRWVFVINVPIGVATVIAGLLVLPEVKAHPGAKLPDLVSTFTVLAGITLLTLGTVQGSSWGWASGPEIAVYAGFALAAAVTLRRTFTHHSPLIEPGLFRSREFTAASIALVLFFITFAAWLLGTVLFFTDVWHYSTLRAGLGVVPGPATAAIFALGNGRIAGIVGRRTLAVAGPLFFAAAAVFWLLAATGHSDYWTGFFPGLVLAGVSSGLSQAPLFAATSGLDARRAATGSAVLNMARQVGSALGVAILVAIYASPDPSSLAAFRRGWVFMAVAVVAASLISLFRRADPAPGGPAFAAGTPASSQPSVGESV
jgi:EmrB/QacA subfamily drug resistance transporter